MGALWLFGINAGCKVYSAQNTATPGRLPVPGLPGCWSSKLLPKVPFMEGLLYHLPDVCLPTQLAAPETLPFVSGPFCL